MKPVVWRIFRGNRWSYSPEAPNPRSVDRASWQPLYTEQAIGDERTIVSLKFQAGVAAFDAAIKAEREACAALCDKHTNPNEDPFAPVSQYEAGCYITAEFLANEIRARGQS